MRSLIRYFDAVGSPGKYPGLDNIRAIAIVLVLLRHAVHFWEQPFDGYFWNFWYNGWLGVDLFFTLSGFLITYHLLLKWPKRDTKKYIYHYLAKRALRIVPLYIFILAVVCFNIVPFFEPSNVITPYTLLVHAAFLQDYISYANIIVSLWSLGVEEKFYLLAPLLIYFVRRYNPSYGIALCIVIILAITIGRSLILLSNMTPITYSNFFWNYRAPFHFSVAGILCGAVVALIYHKFGLTLLSSTKGRILQYLSFFFLLLIMLTQSWVESQHWISTGIVIIVASLCFAFLLYRSLSLMPSSKWGQTKTLRFLAKLSYPLYLSHLLVIPFTKQLCVMFFSVSSLASFWLFFIIYIMLSIFVSVILHFAIEKPFLILKDRF